MFGRQFLFAAALAGLLSACVREREWADCPPPVVEPTSERLVVNVRDLASGGDLTHADTVQDAVLMVFDEDGTFLYRIEMPARSFGKELELPSELVTRAAGRRLTVSAWGNLAENMTAFDEQSGVGHTLSSQFLALNVNTEYPDNWYSPGDVFFGLATIDLEARDLHPVEITQKTARMAVTVRGLPAGESADDYYLSMCEQNDGFTFSGTPLRTTEWCKIRERGVFTTSGDFTTAEPYYVIPSVDPTDASGCNAGVCLYKVGAGDPAQTRALTSDQAGYVTEDGDLNVSGKARVDVEGNHLALSAGLTTNVLISFTSTGDIEVSIRMTDWDEVYDWHTW